MTTAGWVQDTEDLQWQGTEWFSGLWLFGPGLFYAKVIPLTQFNKFLLLHQNFKEFEKGRPENSLGLLAKLAGLERMDNEIHSPFLTHCLPIGHWMPIHVTDSVPRGPAFVCPASYAISPTVLTGLEQV
jgi:hypothetical protein